MLGNIKKLRKQNNLSQQEMAEIIGLKTASAYCKKERGDVPFSLEEIKAIAERFHVAIDTLCP